ncbi:hypothetical protein QYF61_017386 [Mycteria americana]|uniref:Uncharacterized protein n=1 Tax=Mycteria americana TaxID=33587 RepID=A0AAN7RWS9_MYCAM|nr:hypothetical protein QYF61_017386 [Mycteria americana]
MEECPPLRCHLPPCKQSPVCGTALGCPRTLEWAHVNLMRFNRPGARSCTWTGALPSVNTRGGDEGIENSPAEKDVGVLAGGKLDGAHSQESGSIRRQHLPWVPMAGVRQRTPKMPEKQEANAPSQPHEGLPLLHKRRQTDRLEGWEALPCSRVTWQDRVPTPDLPSVPRLEATQAAAPWHALAAPTAGSANVTKLPALPAAASRSSLRGRAHAVGLVASGHRELVPPARGILDDWSMAARAERWGPVPHSPTTHDVALGSSVQAFASGVASHAVAASWEPGQQLAAQGHLALTTGLASPARTAQVQAAWGCRAPAAQPGPDPHAQWGTRAAGEACEPVSPGRCTEGLWERSLARQGHRLPPLRLVHGKPLRTGPEDALKRLVVVQIKAEDLEELEEEDDDETYEDLSGESLLEEDVSIHTICVSPSLPRPSQEPEAGPQKVPGSPDSKAREAAEEADGYSECASPALSEDSDAEPADSHLAGGPRDQGHSKPLPTSAPEDTGFSTSPSPGGSCEESPSATLPASAPEDAQSLAPPLPVAMPQAADDGAETVGTAQGILSDQGFVARAEGQGSASDGPVTWYALLEELLEEWEEEEVPDREAAGEGDGDPPSASLVPLKDEEAEPAASPLARDPWDEGHRAPVVTAVPADAQLSASALPADPMEKADAARTEASHAQATAPQEEPLLAGGLAGACPVPAQPLAYSSPSPTGITALPHPPARQRWRSVVRTARRALRWASSWCCLTGQGEQQRPAASATLESQVYPGLHQKKQGQQVEAGDSALLRRSGETPAGVLRPALESPVQVSWFNPSQQGAHSQESGSIRRQHLPWVPMAGVRQRTPKMPEKQEANAPSQPHEGLPLLHKRRQTDRLEGWEALPCSRVTWQDRVPTPDLPSVPRLEATQAAAPWHALAAPTAGSANVTKLPALPAAASRSSLRGRAHAVGLVASGHRELVPPARGILDDWSMAARAERWGPVPHSPTTHDVALGSSVQAFASGVASHAVAASWEPGQQLAAQGHLALTTGLASPARTAQVQAAWGCRAPAAQPGPDPHAQWGTRAAGEACEPVSPGRCTEGLWERSLARQGHRLPPLRLVHGKPLRTGPEDALKRLVVVQIKAEDLEELEEEDDDETYEDLSGESLLEEDVSIHTICVSPSLPRPSQEPEAGPQKVPGSPDSKAREAAEEADGYSECASPALSEDSDAEPADSHLAGGPRDQGHSKPLPTSAPEDTGFSTSPSPGGSCEESPSATLPASAPEDAQSLAPPLPVAMPQAADDGAETVGTAQGILSDQGFVARAEGQGSASDGPVTWYALLEELLEEWEEEEVPDREAAGEGDGDPPSASLVPLKDEEAEPAASPLARDPWDEGHRTPVVTAVPADAQLSASALPADPMEKADAARTEASHAQATAPQEEPLLAGGLAGACPVPAQPLAYSSPSPTGITALPHPPARQRWRSVVRTARRALRWASSWCCLTGQGEQQRPAASATLESQVYPGLHQKKQGQQVEAGDSALLRRSGETPAGVLRPALESPVQVSWFNPSQQGAHSQESGSIRRQHLPWVPMAGVRQRTPKMPEKQEANAPSQPHEGLPLLHKRRQTDRLEGWEALPCSRVTWQDRVPTPDLPSVPRLEATQAAAPWHALAAPTAGSANVTKLPALPAAASRSSLRGRAHAVGLVASGHRELVPPARGILDDWSMAARAERWGPVPHSPTTHDVALGSSVQAFASGVASHAVAASWEPGQQLAAQGHLALTTGLASPARTAQVQAAWGCRAPAAQPGPDPHAQWGTRAAGEACEPVSPGRCTEGLWERSLARQGHRLPPLRLVHGKPLRTGPEDALKRLVVVQIKAEDLEELEEEDDDETYEDLSGESLLEEDVSIHTICVSPSLPRPSQEPEAGPQKVPGSPDSKAREAAEEADGYSECASPALSEDSDAEPADSHLAGGPRDQGHSKPLPTSAPEDTGFSTSPSPGGSCEESPSATLPASAPEDAQSLAPPLPVAMPQAADDGAETVGTAQGILSDQGFVARAEGQGSASDGPVTWYALLEELLEEWEEEEVPDREAAGEGDGDPPSASLVPLKDEEAEPAASPLARDPWDEGHRAPVVTAVPADAQLSASALPADPMEKADAARTEASHAQATAPQEEPLLAGGLAGACPVPAQPLAYSSPSPTGITALPHPPARQRWRSVVRTARRALRWASSWCCLTGQGDQQRPAASATWVLEDVRCP